MKLCGLNIPFESQKYEKVASNRIHSSELADSTKVLAYNNWDIAGSINSIALDAEGIWEAVQQRKCLDIDKKPIDPATVKEELAILSTDLQKIADVVRSTLTSEAGKKIWPEEAPLMHGLGPRISIPDKIKILIDMAGNFKTFAKS